MKRQMFLLSIIFFGCIFFSNAQQRFSARGTEFGELYLNGAWYRTFDPVYGPPFYDTVRNAVFRLTEYGQKLTIQYEYDHYEWYPDRICRPLYILSDISQGVVYSVNHYSKDNYPHTQLWVSFDYGKNWFFREEWLGDNLYFAANTEGLIYGGRGFYKSTNYGQDFTFMTGITMIGMEPGLSEEEFFHVHGSYPIAPYKFLHTYDLYRTYTEIPIDSQFVGVQMSGINPAVFRGGLPNEVYISSWFPDWSYKVSFSADTGNIFRHVFTCEHPQIPMVKPSFIPDREPGVFYIIKVFEWLEIDYSGTYVEICIDYYRDYGETLVDTYCHELHKDYVIETCESVHDLKSEKPTENSVLLNWSQPDEVLEVEGYRIFRNHHLLTKEIITETFYLDENLQHGNYEYNILVYYATGCISEVSNFVSEYIEEDTCEAVKDLISDKPSNNSVLLLWTEPETDLQIDGYSVFRNKQLQNQVLITNPSYIDEDLPVGKYVYYVVVHYTNDCISDTSNHVSEDIVLGINEIVDNENIVLYPNPTTGELIIASRELVIEKVEISDVSGRKLQSYKFQMTYEATINISHFPTGIYFLTIHTEAGQVIKRVLKE